MEISQAQGSLEQTLDCEEEDWDEEAWEHVHRLEVLYF